MIPTDFTFEYFSAVSSSDTGLGLPPADAAASSSNASLIFVSCPRWYRVYSENPITTTATAISILGPQLRRKSMNSWFSLDSSSPARSRI